MMDADLLSHEGARRAALALHALGPGDQEWLMERLDSQQRVSLKTLLQELQSLGLPPDAEIVRRALDERSQEVARARSSEDTAGLCRMLEREALPVRELMLSTLDAEAAAAVCRSWILKDELQPLHRAGLIESVPVRTAVLEAWRKLAREQERGS